MRKLIVTLAFATGCATAAGTGPRLASSGPMSFEAPAPACEPLKTKRTGLGATALTMLGVSAGTGIATVAEIGNPNTHDAKVGLGITAAVAGAAAVATGIPAWTYQARYARCR